MKTKRFWMNEGGKYITHWNGFGVEHDPDSIIFQSDDCWKFMQEYADLENKELVEAYDEYVEFLGKELSRHEAFTVVRPYMAASGEVIAKGVELRAKIEAIKINKK